jgi:DNA-binding MarR family transcriptional regulator
MSISKVRRVPAATKRVRQAEVFRLPTTASRSALLDNGSDERLRQLVYDLLTIATRMNLLREHLGRGMGLSGPQYSVLMAIAQLQGRIGVGVGTVAKRLHVSSAFIATETGKLSQIGLVIKRANPKDRRGVLLSLSRSAQALIERNRDEIRATNDAFFCNLSRKEFIAMSSTMASVVQGSRRAMARQRDLQEAGATLGEAAE